MLGKLYGSPEGKCYGEKLGEGGQSLLGMSLLIPLGGEQVDAGLWDSAPARRSICLLVPQLGSEG